MTKLRIVALSAVVAFGIAYATGPAGSDTTAACGSVIQIKDAGIRASFAKFEAQQSAAASKICASFRNAGL